MKQFKSTNVQKRKKKCTKVQKRKKGVKFRAIKAFQTFINQNY